MTAKSRIFPIRWACSEGQLSQFNISTDKSALGWEQMFAALDLDCSYAQVATFAKSGAEP